jgi:DNA-binding YbaB/EbfC family protein
MFGNMQEKQAQMAKLLAEMEVVAEAGGGVVTVKANAARQILDIKIDKTFQYDDIEELEDLLLTAVNRVIAKAAEIEAEESQKMLKEMLPPGMENLGGMFGM